MNDAEAIIFSFDGFVPEWALFELMSTRKAIFDPIDPARGLFAYRDMGQFRVRAATAGSDTVVRVYLDVLRREARMYGNGKHARELMCQFAEELAGFAGCGVRREATETPEAVSDAVSSAQVRNSDAVAASGGTASRSDKHLVVGQSTSGKPGLPFATLKKLVRALLFQHRWHGTKKDLAKRFGTSESQILRLLNPEYPKGTRNRDYDQAFAAQAEKNKHSNMTGRKDGKHLGGATLDSTRSSTELPPDKSAELNDVPEPWRSMDTDALKRKALDLEPGITEDQLPENLHQLKQMVWLLADQRSDKS